MGFFDIFTGGIPVKSAIEGVGSVAGGIMDRFGFTKKLSGLGQLIEAGIQSDRLVTFGD